MASPTSSSEMTTISLISAYLKNILFPKGTIATIRWGRLSGCKYLVSENSGWSPIWGRWEPGAQATYARIIAKGQVVYDLGANVGLHSMLFSMLVGPEGHVYAFEPVQEN